MSTVPSGVSPATASGPTLTEEEQALTSASAVIANRATTFFDFIFPSASPLCSNARDRRALSSLPIPSAPIEPPTRAGVGHRRPRHADDINEHRNVGALV